MKNRGVVSSVDVSRNKAQIEQTFLYKQTTRGSNAVQEFLLIIQ